MKKALTILLTAIIALSLSACGGNPSESLITTDNAEAQVSSADAKELLAEWTGKYIDQGKGNYIEILSSGEITLNSTACTITRIEDTTIFFDYQGTEYSFFTAEKGKSIACNYGYDDNYYAFDLEGVITGDQTDADASQNAATGRPAEGEVVSQLSQYSDRLGFYECGTGDDYKLIELHETGVYFNNWLVSFTENQSDGMIGVFDKYGVYEYSLYFDGNTLYSDLGMDFYNYQPYSYTTAPKSWWQCENYIGTFTSENGDVYMTVMDNGAMTYYDGSEMYSLMLPERLVVDAEFDAHITFSIESDSGVKENFRMAHVMGGDFEDDPNRVEIRTGTGFDSVILYREGEQIDNSGSGENVSAYENINSSDNGNIVSNGSSGSDGSTNANSSDSFSKYYCTQDPSTISIGSEVLFAELSYINNDGEPYYQLSLGYGDDANALHTDWYATFSGFGETQISTQYWGSGEMMTPEVSDTVTLGGSLDCLELTLVSKDGTRTNHFTMYKYDMTE